MPCLDSISKWSSSTLLMSVLAKFIKSENSSETSTVPSSSPKTYSFYYQRPSSPKSSEWELKAYNKKSSNTLKPNTEEKSLNWKSWNPFSKKKLPSSSLMPPSLPSNNRSSPIKCPLKPESEPSHQLTSLSQPVPLVWIHLKSTSSTPWTSQPRSSKVKLKSPRTSESAQLERKSRLQKLLFWKSWIFGHSSTEWRSSTFMTTEQSSQKMSSTSIPLPCWHNSSQVSRTWLDCHCKPDTQLKLQFHWFLEVPSRTSLLCRLSLGTCFDNCSYKIKELENLATSSQPVVTETKAATKAPVKEEKPAKKEEPKEEEEDGGMGGLFDWIWEIIWI